MKINTLVPHGGKVAAGLGLAGVMLAGPVGPAGAAESTDPNPVSVEVQHQRDLADGKLDPEHLRHKAEKDAEESRLGLGTTPGQTFSPAQVVIKGTTYFKPAGVTSADANNLCAYGDHCLYYNSGNTGANFRRTDTTSTIADYAGYKFPAGLAGGGQNVKNNAASACNESGHYTFGVFYNSNWQGDRAWYSVDGDCRNLPSYLKNENASGQSVRSW